MQQVIDYLHRRKKANPKPVCAFVYDLDALQTHVSGLMKTLPSRCRLFYAMKANSEAPILKALAPLVHGFEVASLGEVRKVRAISPEAPIIFGGPGKTDEEIEGAIDLGLYLLHVESRHELQRIGQIAHRRGVEVPILLRVNLHGALPQATLAMAGRPTQFGIDEAALPDLIRLAVALKNVKLAGFHLHSLSNQLDPEQHVRLIALYCARVRGWIETFGLKIDYINAGGGVGVNYADLTRQFDWNFFSERLAGMLQVECPPGAGVLFECGRYLTAACGYYVTEVLDIKQNHGKHYAIINGGSHHFRLPAAWQHSHPFSIVPVARWDYPFSRPELLDSEVTVAGQLCTPKDILARDVRISRLRIGDLLLFPYAGAYGWSISCHDFLSHPHPDHIYLSEIGPAADKTDPRQAAARRSWRD